MIIDASIIIGLVVSHLVAGIVPAFIMTRAKSKSIFKPSNHKFNQVLEVQEEFLTEEEHIQYLIKKFPEPWDEYNYDWYLDRPIHEAGDRLLARLLIGISRGTYTATLSKYTIKVSDGTEIWIDNKYFSYGSVHRTTHGKHYMFNCNYRPSPYVFLLTLELENLLMREQSTERN